MEFSDLRTPYTYHLYNKITEQHYYGVRYGKGCHPSDLWVTYFSSSVHVKRLIEEYGKDSFDVEVRKTFISADAALTWEQRVLRRLKVTQRLDWLNRVDHGTKCPQFSLEHRQKISESNRRRVGPNTGRKFSEEHKQKLRESKLGTKNPNYQRKYSEEELAELSRRRTGEKRSPEFCEAQRQRAKSNDMNYVSSFIKDQTHGAEKRRGQKRTIEQRQRMREAQKMVHALGAEKRWGQKRTPEQRQKMSEAQYKRQERERQNAKNN